MTTLKCPTAEDIAKKWGEVTPGRASYYKKGAVGAGGEWESKTLAAAKTYKQAVTAADIDKRFSGGVKAAGGAKYDRKVEDVGVDRYPAGVAAAIPDMKSGIAPYRDVIEGLTVSERGPRGSPQNWKISQEVGEALHKKRLALLAAGS